jgi:hypothetical protein
LRTLRRARWGWTLRLGARSAVRVGEEALLVRALLERGAPQCWTVWTAASYGWGARRGACTLVVGRGLQTLPAYQRTVGSLRHRTQRQAECHRVKSYRYAVSQTDAWVVLCTVHLAYSTRPPNARYPHPAHSYSRPTSAQTLWL